MTQDHELRILQQLVTRGGRQEHLQFALELTADEVGSAVDALEERRWVWRGQAWYDPGDKMEVLLVTREGRAELARREMLSGDAGADEPVEVTRQELLDDLERRGFPRDQMEVWPGFRASRYLFYPSIPAWAEIPET